MKKMVFLLSLLLLFSCGMKKQYYAVSLEGVWEGADKASQRKIGILQVAANSFSWEKSGSSCMLSYTLVASYPDALFSNGFETPLPPEQFVVYKLALEEKPCAKGIRFVQFFLSRERKGHAEFLTYDEKESRLGWYRLQKREP